MEVAENVALALSVVTLFVLCEPRDKVTLNCLRPQGYRDDTYREMSGQKCEVDLYRLGRAPWLMLLFAYLGSVEETDNVESHSRNSLNDMSACPVVFTKWRISDEVCMAIKLLQTTTAFAFAW